MLSAVIFDMDGVLVDSHPVHERAWRRLMDSLGRSVSEQQLEFMLDGHKREDILRFFFGELSPSELRQYGLLKDSFFAECSAEMRLMPGVGEFLAALSQAGLRLAVASSASRSRAQRLLEQFDIARYFAAVVTGDDVVCGKPDPAIFQLACQRLGGAAGSSLVFEDAVSGIKGARAAGMKCLGIAASGRAQRLYEAGASHVVPDFIGLQVKAVSELFDRAAEFPRLEPASLTMIPLTVRR